MSEASFNPELIVPFVVGYMTMKDELSFCFCLVGSLCSKLLYDITRNDKASATDPTIVEAWIRCLNEKLHGTIRYTKRLHSILVNRVAHLRHKVKGLKGGRAIERFLSQTWKLQLQDETDATEVETLRTKLDTSEKENKKLQNTVELLKKDMSTKVCSISKLLHSTPVRHHHKPYEELSERQRRRIKRGRETACEASLAWLEQEGYEAVSVELRNKETGNIEQISLKRQDMEELFGSGSQITESEIDKLNMMLYVKDRYNVSDGAYHEMAKICREMP